MYWHVFAAGETTYTWTTSGAVSGVAFAAAFASVDPTNPVDTSSANVAGAGERRLGAVGVDGFGR